MIFGFGVQEEKTAINIIEECIAVKTKDSKQFESEVKAIHSSIILQLTRRIFKIRAR